MSELNEINRIVNRHKARMLGRLEEANCPDIFIDSVCSDINWLRSDLNEYVRTERNDDDETRGNH